MGTDRNELVTVTVTGVDKETAKAIHVITEDGDMEWIPKSQIHDDSEVYDSQHFEGELVIPRWLAEEKVLTFEER